MSHTSEFKTIDDVLQRWLKRARESQLSHHLMTESLENQHTWLGILIIIATAVAGATTLATEITENSKLALGLLTLLATILTALQTFLKVEQRASRHRIAAAGYGQVRRKLELAASLTAEQAEARIKEAEVALNELAQESPSVSKRSYDKAMKRSK